MRLHPSVRIEVDSSYRSQILTDFDDFSFYHCWKILSVKLITILNKYSFKHLYLCLIQIHFKYTKKVTKKKKYDEKKQRRKRTSREDFWLHSLNQINGMKNQSPGLSILLHFNEKPIATNWKSPRGL